MRPGAEEAGFLTIAEPIGDLLDCGLFEVVRQSPKLDWNSLLHPSSSAAAITRYCSQHTLWAEVCDSASVRVFTGSSKDVIRDRGYMVVLHKDAKWEISSYCCWWSNGWGGYLHVPSDDEH